jgi:hypothetical protein
VVARIPGAAKELGQSGMKDLKNIFSKCIAWAKKLNLDADTRTLKFFPTCLYNSFANF